MSHANYDPVNDDVKSMAVQGGWFTAMSRCCDQILRNPFILIPVSSFLSTVVRALTKCGARVERYEQRSCGQVEVVAERSGIMNGKAPQRSTAKLRSNATLGLGNSPRSISAVGVGLRDI